MAEGQQLLGERGGAFAGANNLREIGVERVVLAELALSERGLTEHDADNVVEVVGNAAGEPPQGFELLGLAQFALEFVLPLAKALLLALTHEEVRDPKVRRAGRDLGVAGEVVGDARGDSFRRRHDEPARLIALRAAQDLRCDQLESEALLAPAG